MTKKKPLLSIITINYNNASALENTIKSVLTQQDITPEDLEYIIIDGGSTDGSVEIIKKYVMNKKYASFVTYWCSEKDDGVYNAMNKGLAKVNGKFVGIMNSGDSYFPNVLSHIKTLAKRNPDAILYGASKNIRKGHFEGVVCPGIEYLEKSMIPHNATFVPMKYYNQYGFYDESFKVLADYNCFLNFYVNKLPFVFTDCIVCNYELDGLSMTSNLVDTERELIHKKYGFYTPIPQKQIRRQKIKNFIKKLLPFLAG